MAEKKHKQKRYLVDYAINADLYPPISEMGSTGLITNRIVCKRLLCKQITILKTDIERLGTVQPAKSDSDVMFCLQCIRDL